MFYFDGKFTIRMVAVIVLTLVMLREAWSRLGRGHGHSRSRLDAIVL